MPLDPVLHTGGHYADTLSSTRGPLSSPGRALGTRERLNTGGRTVTDPQRRGFSIRIFLPEGIPDGLRLVEKSNWTGQAVVCPRSRFPDVKSRDEFGRTGVYVLVGPSEEDDLPMVYIGEGDPVRPRLEQHNAKKDFWTSLITFGSKDENLNKAHVQYLEARLIKLAQEAKRCNLDNSNIPNLPNLSEADTADVESFLDEMLLIFPVLGVSVFEKPAPPPVGKKQLLHLNVKGIVATGYEVPQGFVVLAGSKASAEVAEYSHHYLNLRRALQEKEILVQEGDHLVVTQNYTFNSPSAASGVLLGRASNGRVEWKDKDNVSLKELQATDLPAGDP